MGKTVTRRPSRPVQVGPLTIGGGSPIVVQSMNNTDSRDVQATLAQIRQLAAAGCELTRLAIPDREAAEALRAIRAASPLPIVADIHFDYRLALLAIDAGADKIRVNPGNLGGKRQLREVADAAEANGIPIRVGVNAGSLSRDIIERFGGVTAEAVAESALSAVSALEDCHFEDIVVSVKASDARLNFDAHHILRDLIPYPFHIGLTEAGTLRAGLVRSSIAIGALLAEGIGDTVRVSLTADPLEEVRAAYEILATLGLRRRGAIVTSCPTCGRTEVNLQEVAEEVERQLADWAHPVHIAVMGCPVNGPGEARQADVGLAGGRDGFLLFRHGKVIRSVSRDEAVAALLEEVRAYCADSAAGWD